MYLGVYTQLPGLLEKEGMGERANDISPQMTCVYSVVRLAPPKKIVEGQL